MSYIVKALRKLEQERRRVTVTEIGLFRGLSERWQSEKPVWRYLLGLSLVVNTSVAVWLLTNLFSGGSSMEAVKLDAQATVPSAQSARVIVERPYQHSSNPEAPAKISLEVRHSQQGGAPAQGRNRFSLRRTPALPEPGSIERNDRHTLRTSEHLHREVPSADDAEVHETGAYSSPNIMIWKDEKGNIHYSGIAGKN